jgi:hypothetical protein
MRSKNEGTTMIRFALVTGIIAVVIILAGIAFNNYSVAMAGALVLMTIGLAPIIFPILGLVGLGILAGIVVVMNTVFGEKITGTLVAWILSKFY